MKILNILHSRVSRKGVLGIKKFPLGHPVVAEPIGAVCVPSASHITTATLLSQR